MDRWRSPRQAWPQVERAAQAVGALPRLRALVRWWAAALAGVVQIATAGVGLAQVQAVARQQQAVWPRLAAAVIVVVLAAEASYCQYRNQGYNPAHR